MSITIDNCARTGEQLAELLTDHRVPLHTVRVDRLRAAQGPHRVVVTAPQPGQRPPVSHSVVDTVTREGVLFGV